MLRTKKLASMVLAAFMVISMGSLSAFAENSELTKAEKKAIVENTYSGFDENVTVVYEDRAIMPMYESPMSSYTVRKSPATRIGAASWKLLSGQDRVYMETGNYSITSNSVYFNILDLDNDEYVSNAFMGPVSRNSLIYYSVLNQNTRYAFYVKAGPYDSNFTAQIGIITD